MRPPVFTTVLHADWSAAPPGRWVAQAALQGGTWRAEAPRQVPEKLAAFVEELFALTARGGVLAAFDFPIGLPLAYGARTGLAGFPILLDRLGQGDWAAFFEVAADPGQVGLRQPFYPARPGGALRQHLLAGHDAADHLALLRQCERPRSGRRQVGNMFWTLGANQVGKAALAGWKGVVQPARRAGAALWPFDGSLAALGRRGGLTLAESYPGDAYARLGAPFGPRESKRRQADRACKADAMTDWARAQGVALSDALQRELRDGFGPEPDRGGDRFDAVAGLLATLAVVTAQWPEGAPDEAAVRCWEGWILGRPA